MFVRVCSVSDDGEDEVYDVVMAAPHHSFVAEGIVVHNCEAMGAVKLDLLGLRHLDTLMYARNLVYQHHNVWLDYRGDGGPADAKIIEFGYETHADKDIWAQIASGHTVGIFQIETPDLTRMSALLKPLNERDVAALISIVRPGVKDVGLDAEFIKRRAGQSEVVYDHPLMEPITSETYGVMIYQEQLIRAVRELASFSPDEADTLRKAIGKKVMDKVLSFRNQFIDGCLDKMDRKAAERIWASIEASARYAFNKSHAVGYATVTTWEIWTKHYYPTEYVLALMATDVGSINRYVREARRLGIKVLPPDITQSGDKFSIDKTGAIRYGFEAIKGIGANTTKDILKARSQRQFESMDDYLARAGAGASINVVMDLIGLGAFEAFGDREYCITRLERHRILADVAINKFRRLTPSQKDEIWQEKIVRLEAKYKIPRPEYTPREIYLLERRLVGTYVTVDPMAEWIDKIRDALQRKGITSPSQIEEQPEDSQFLVGGQIKKISRTTVKKKGPNFGRAMGFLTLDWEEQEFEITVFPQTWHDCLGLIKLELPVLCEVKRDEKGIHLKGIHVFDFTMGIEEENG